MEVTNQFLPADIEAAVAASHGGPVTVPGKQGQYVVMNADVFGGAFDATPAELEESVEAIRRSLQQMAEGRLRDVDEVLNELEARYGS